MEQVIHLHWLYRQGLKALRGVTKKAGALCGEEGLKREQVTSFVDDATCEECLKRVENPPPDPPKIS